MEWFDLKGDELITRRCATEGCGGQPTSRLESGGIGSDYCSGCREKIESPAQKEQEAAPDYDDDYYEDDLPDDDDDLDDCGMMANGQCTQAGTEWCDWSCPRNRV